MNKREIYELPFEKTDFIKRVSKLRGEIIGRSTEIKNGKIVDKKDFVETETDEYIASVMKSASNIIFTYEQLEFIPVFMRRFPDRKFYNSYGINHPKYLQYHLENHFLKVATILDQCFRLTSEIYRLGISPELISLRHLRDNKHTKQTKSLELLKKLDKEIQGIKTIRNRITHRGEFNDTTIDKVAEYYFLTSTTEKEGKPLFPEEVLKYHMRNAVINRTKLVTANTIAIRKFILRLFKESHIEFELKMEILEK